MDQGDEVSVLSLYHALPVLAKQEQHGVSTVRKHGGMCCSIACNTWKEGESNHANQKLYYS